MNRKSILYLENGEVFNGLSFGYEGETAGEIVFNTSMTCLLYTSDAADE